jgi:AAA family ATP:ADP antiporter
MSQAAAIPNARAKSPVDRALSLVSDVRAGEGATALLMLVNIFLLLICYSVIKTVREPLILLGGGAEVRSYAAAGQALLLMGFVPAYSWMASRVDRVKLLVGVTLFFIACIELFASAVAMRIPYVGVAFFIWVGIFNISLVAQFWSFAADLYSKDAGDRLFPIIVIGMTAGAPLGSLIAGRLFAFGVTPQVILQVSAVLLGVSTALYLWINAREERRQGAPADALPSGGGFRLVLGNRYLGLIALLVVLLNVVNTTGEYLVARLLTVHVKELALLDPSFDQQAFIGAFSGNYQFWVNVVALLLQALVTSRLVKYQGLRGALLALPLIALGGYAIIAAGVGFSVVRWIKTAENATDYSIMNTARQLLWLPATREEKYKAKQAIDTFFVRAGDLLSAGVVFLGTGVLQLTVEQFAIGNMLLTAVWLAVALLILRPRRERSFAAPRRFVPAAVALTLLIAAPAAATAQETREEQLAAERARKAEELRPYEPNGLERRLEMADRMMLAKRAVYPFIGSVFEGGGLAVGPGYRARFGDTGAFKAHAAWSIRNAKTASAALDLPRFGDGRFEIDVHGSWLDVPRVAFYGVGAASRRDDRTNFLYRTTTVGATARFKASPRVTIGGGLEYIGAETERTSADSTVETLNPTYRRTRAFAEFDSRTSPDYSRRGGLYRLEWSDYHQINAGRQGFRRLDAEVQQLVPLLRENWVIALRAMASSTVSPSGEDVPYFLMPTLGGSRALRGYPSWRFRDRNRILFTGEYRWTAGPFLDMAAFFDAGKVTASTGDLNLRGLRTSHGLGLSVHTERTTIVRIEVARSSEGTTLILSFSPSF